MANISGWMQRIKDDPLTFCSNRNKQSVYSFAEHPVLRNENEIKWYLSRHIKNVPSLATSCVLSCSQKLPIMTLFTILLLLLIVEKGPLTL